MVSYMLMKNMLFKLVPTTLVKNTLANIFSTVVYVVCMKVRFKDQVPPEFLKIWIPALIIGTLIDIFNETNQRNKFTLSEKNENLVSILKRILE